MSHELVRLGGKVAWRGVAWRILEHKFGEAYSNGPSQPLLPTRLMAGRAKPRRCNFQQRTCSGGYGVSAWPARYCVTRRCSVTASRERTPTWTA